MLTTGLRGADGVSRRCCTAIPQHGFQLATADATLGRDVSSTLSPAPVLRNARGAAARSAAGSLGWPKRHIPESTRTSRLHRLDNRYRQQTACAPTPLTRLAAHIVSQCDGGGCRARTDRRTRSLSRG